MLRKNLSFGPANLIIWTVFAVIVASCTAPQVVTSLVPEAPEGYTEHGREYITLTNDSIYAILGFDGIYDEVLIFDLVVVNKGNAPLTLEPGIFYYEVLDSAMALNSTLPPVAAIHPDTISHKYEDSIEKMKGSQQSNKFFGILEATAGILYNTSGFIATEDPGFIVDMIAGTFNTADYYVTRDKAFKENISVLSDEKLMVRKASHQTQTLEPGESVSGFVFFPQDREAKYYMFCFPIDDELFQFVYRQRFSYRY